MSVRSEIERSDSVSDPETVSDCKSSLTLLPSLSDSSALSSSSAGSEDGSLLSAAVQSSASYSWNSQTYLGSSASDLKSSSTEFDLSSSYADMYFEETGVGGGAHGFLEYMDEAERSKEKSYLLLRNLRGVKGKISMKQTNNNKTKQTNFWFCCLTLHSLFSLHLFLC